jgi:hypothetical protein
MKQEKINLNEILQVHLKGFGDRKAVGDEAEKRFCPCGVAMNLNREYMQGEQDTKERHRKYG